MARKAVGVVLVALVAASMLAHAESTAGMRDDCASAVSAGEAVIEALGKRDKAALDRLSRPESEGLPAQFEQALAALDSAGIQPGRMQVTEIELAVKWLPKGGTQEAELDVRVEDAGKAARIKIELRPSDKAKKLRVHRLRVK